MCDIKYYKCPGYFCIPRRYVCNGIWECPQGLEETSCNLDRCQGLFKCLNVSMCLSVESYCDGIHDCLYGDDEIFCEPGLMICGTNCSCLLYSISCTGPLDIQYFSENDKMSDNMISDKQNKDFISTIFTCHDQTMITSSLICDGIIHCPTEEDEKVCQQFRLPTPLTLCNGKWKCPIGLEENLCPRAYCPGYFKCLNSTICISMHSICDSIFDCPNIDDEYFCSKDYHKCPSGCKV